MSSGQLIIQREWYYYHLFNHQHKDGMDGVAITSSPKVASSSIRNSLKTKVAHMYTQHTAAHRLRSGDLKEIILFVREPMDRLGSFWDMIQRDNNVRGGMGLPDYSNFEDFVVNHVISRKRHKGDHHWIPQTDIHTYRGRFLPTVTYPFELLRELWPTIVDVQLEQKRIAPTRTPIEELTAQLSDDTILELSRYYDNDYALYHKTLARGEPI